MTSPPALGDAARRLLGPCEVTPVAGTSAARVVTAGGETLFAKQHGSREKHDREVRAYRHWTIALGSSAPALRAADTRARVIIITALPGRLCPVPGTLAVSRQAGELLRRFHDARPDRELAWFRDWLQDRARWWMCQARSLLPQADARTITRHLADLGQGPIPRGGPCHLDFQPRNWLVSPSGNVSIIDFEHARISLPARDFVRLRFRIWTARPDLRDAFLDGYGRPLTQAEDETIWHLGALDALTALVRGHQSGNQELIAAGLATLRQL